MRYVVDLHSHSGYAGGVGDISLPVVATTMRKKGINVFGVGDCLQPAWRERLGQLLEPREQGLFGLAGAEGDQRAARFVMQTEVIITSPVVSGGRKGTHVVLLFPSFAAADEAIALLRRWEVKLDIGRPFIKCDSNAQVAERCEALRGIDDSVMIIPAHVLMPQGIYGSDHPVDSLRDVFGDFADRISAVETGLSADPELLAVLPELDNRSLLSHSDCHSGALNRVGREFTALEIATPSYNEIVAAIRSRKIRYTAEFNPAEGRYFLTGHKPGLQGHGQDYCYFSPDTKPGDNVCPICGKRLTLGVLDRLLHLAEAQAGGKKPRQLFKTKPRQQGKALIPLVEVIAAGLGVKSVSSKKILSLYDTIIAAAGTEAELWEMDNSDIDHLLASLAPSTVVEAILMVQSGDFSFQPGFDGQYGQLVLGKKIDWFGLEKNTRVG